MKYYYGEPVYDGLFFATIGQYKVIRVDLKKETALVEKGYAFLKDAIDHADTKNKVRGKGGDIYLVFDDDGKCRYENEKICNIEHKYTSIAKKFMSIGLDK
jgi:hypothetical protein